MNPRQEELFNTHQAMAEEYARVFCRKHSIKRYNHASMINAARFGCFIAALKFDESKKLRFWTYAQKKVLFAMLDEMRTQSKQKIKNPNFEYNCLRIKYLSEMTENELPASEDDYKESRRELAENLINKVKDETVRLVLRARFIVGIKEHVLSELYETTPARIIALTKKGIEEIKRILKEEENG
jgi:DNA-directed RNA polymerase specialized sigma subunit